MTVLTKSPAADRAQREAFDRILGNHLLYCTVCDNNNGNCTVHNTTALLKVEHQNIPFKNKPYEVDLTNPFYRYDPNQCILCGRCVEACQNLQVNETLSIRWEDSHPRVLWDGGKSINESQFLRSLTRTRLHHRIRPGYYRLRKNSVARRAVADWQLLHVSWSPLEGASGSNETSAIEQTEG